MVTQPDDDPPWPRAEKPAPPSLAAEVPLPVRAVLLRPAGQHHAGRTCARADRGGHRAAVDQRQLPWLPRSLVVDIDLVHPDHRSAAAPQSAAATACPARELGELAVQPDQVALRGAGNLRGAAAACSAETDIVQGYSEGSGWPRSAAGQIRAPVHGDQRAVIQRGHFRRARQRRSGRICVPKHAWRRGLRSCGDLAAAPPRPRGR